MRLARIRSRKRLSRTRSRVRLSDLHAPPPGHVCAEHLGGGVIQNTLRKREKLALFERDVIAIKARKRVDQRGVELLRSTLESLIDPIRHSIHRSSEERV